MFPITSRPAVQQAAPTAPRRPAGAAGRFSLSGGEAPARGAGGVAAAMPLDALVALQAEEDVGERRRRQVARGQTLLSGLDRLKAALLSGRIPQADLARLKQDLEARRETSDDPGLDEVLAHIELRVAVELAKLGR